MEAHRPIPDSYWLLEGRLLAGEYPGAPTRASARRKLQGLLDAGIRSFIDLTEDTEPLEPYEDLLAEIAREQSLDCRYRRFAVPDLGTPSPDLMRTIITAIRAELDEGRPVYFHCFGGIGRTGTVSGCWLVDQGMSADEAFERIAGLRHGTPDAFKHSPETSGQRAFIRAWAQTTDVLEDLRDPVTLSRYRGALLGLAAGDALGTTLEFAETGRFTQIDDMIGGGPFDLKPGQWTDDTSMALCLAESLVKTGEFNATDQMTRYLRWWREGYWSSNGRCFDVGVTIADALRRFEETGNPLAGSADSHTAGNGSLMRLAPVPLRYAANPVNAVRYAAASSRTTHAAREAIDACRYFAALMVGALQGRAKSEILGDHFAPPGVDWGAHPLCPSIAGVASGSFKHKRRAQVDASGYVVHTLEAALWAFHQSGDFREGALLAVNLGHDADTTGAVYGQLAGAHYGVESIPAEWRARIARASEIANLAVMLFDAASESARAENG